MLAIQRRGKRRYGPALLGFAGAAVLMAGKFVVGSQAMIFAGVLALLAAAVWRSRIQQSVATEECSQCEEVAGGSEYGSSSDRVTLPASPSLRKLRPGRYRAGY
jgi:hypothetical protein